MSKTATAKSQSLTAAATRVGIGFSRSGPHQGNVRLETAFYDAISELEETAIMLRDLRASFDPDDGPTEAQEAEERPLEAAIYSRWEAIYGEELPEDVTIGF